MAKSDPVADALARLKACAAEPRSDASLAEIAKALSGKSNLPAAKAADIVADEKLSQFAPALVAAFDRFMQKPAITDKGCGAKTAIAKALYELESPAAELFLRGIRHVQPEPDLGRPIRYRRRSARLLRARAGPIELPRRDDRTGRPADGLRADCAPDGRPGRSGYSENPAGAPLLRMKLIAGDATYEVTAECLVSAAQAHAARGRGIRRPIARFARRRRWRSRRVRPGRIATTGGVRSARRPVRQGVARRIPQAAAARDRDDAAARVGGVLAADHRDEHRTTAVDAIEALRIYRSDEAVRGKVSAPRRSAR